MAKRTAPERTEVLQVSGKYTGECPVCGKEDKLDVTREPNGRSWWVQCWTCEANGIVGAAYLAEVAEAVGCRPYELKQDPLMHLGFLLDAAPSGPPSPLPANWLIEAWRERLFASDKPLLYLTERRKLALPILRRHKVGYDAGRDVLTFPVYAGGELVNVLRRRPRDGAQMITMTARPRDVPYPDMPRGTWQLLVAGELDALTGRGLRLPTVTVCAVGLPDHVIPQFVGRPTAVMFDVGEERAAERVVAKLRAAGGRAQAVRLERLGLSNKADLNDLHRLRGEAARQTVLELVREERRAA